MTKSELREILGGIADPEGVLTPEAVVEAARAPTHELHGRFEWDDEAAAHAHRLETARVIIRSVSYPARVVHGRTVSMPVYVHSSQETCRPGYVALDSVARASQEAAVVLRDEMGRVAGAAKRALAVASRIASPDLAPRLSHLLAEAEAITAAIASPPAAPPAAAAPPPMSAAG